MLMISQTRKNVKLEMQKDDEVKAEGKEGLPCYLATTTAFEGAESADIVG